MIFSDSGAAVCTLGIALLLMTGRLEVWHIYVLMALSSSFSAFQWPAYTAATTLLVPKKQLGRSSGMVQVSEAVAQILSPVIAGVLMGVIGIHGVILVDVATFLVALGTLLAVRVPRPPATVEGKAARGSLLHEASFGWTYIRARPGLLGLLFFFAATNFASGIVGVLFTPLVLSFATVDVLGLLMSIGGIGFLAGSLTLSAWGGPRRRIYGILGASTLSGVVLFAAGLPPRIWILGAAACLYFFSLPIINGCSQAIWQSKTAPDVQGRVFAVRRMIAWASLPLAYVAAGPLADRVFEPLLAEGGLLVGTVGRIIGVGKGRGIGLMFVVLGGMILLSVLAAWLHPRVRHVDTELADHAGSAQAPAP